MNNIIKFIPRSLNCWGRDENHELITKEYFFDTKEDLINFVNTKFNNNNTIITDELNSYYKTPTYSVINWTVIGWYQEVRNKNE